MASGVLALVCVGLVGFYLYIDYFGQDLPILFQSSTTYPMTKSFESNITTCTLHKTNLSGCTPEFKRYHIMEFEKVKGHVGNQLFQLFMLLSTAKRNCYTPLLWNFKKELGDIFELQYNEKDPSITNNVCYKTLDYKYSNAYDATAVEGIDTSVNWRFIGFFQSWKYFNSHTQFIKSVLKFKTEVSDTVNDFFSTHQIQNDTNICVHVRRGDFLKDRNKNLGYTVADKSYFEKAMAHFLTKYENETLNFIFISDDIKWCQDNVKGDNIFFSTFLSRNGGPGIDLALMSTCNHCITTAGSFGWMGAWLGGGDVIYYNGYPKPGSWVDGQLNKTEYYPSHWIGMQ